MKIGKKRIILPKNGEVCLIFKIFWMYLVDNDSALFLCKGVLSMFQFLPFFNAMKDLFFLVGYVSSYNLFPEPLEQDEEKMYLERYEQGDEEAKKVLIERNLRLVAHIAKKYANAGTEQEDIISIGTIGLIKAVNSYKGNKGVRLRNLCG